MKKSKREKLTLHRETVRNLQQGVLGKVQGAAQSNNTCAVSWCLECPPPTADPCVPW